MATERVGRAVLEFSTDSRQFNTDIDKAGQKIVDLKKKAGDTSATFVSLSGDLGKVSKAFTDLGGSVGPIAPALSKVQGMIAGVASGVATLGPVGAIAAVGLAAVTAGALAAVTAIGAIGAVAYKSTRAAADLGDELFTLSNKTGLSVEALSKFKFIAQQTDTDVDAITKSVSKLGQNLATGSKDTAAAIKAIGLSVADIRKMKPDEAFTAIITAIGKIPDAGQRAAVGAAIFGKQFREIAQLTKEDLKGLWQQAEDLGLVFSTEFAVAGDRFNDALGAIGLSVDALQSKLGSEFLPVAIAFVELFEEEFGKALGVAGTAAGGLATTVADVALLVGQSLASIVEVGAPVVKWLAQFFAGAFITNLGLLDLFGRVVSAIGGMATILGKFDPTMGAVAAAAERTGASLQAFAKSGTVGVVQVTGAISQYADAVEVAAKSTGERLPGAVAKVKAEIAAQAKTMRDAQAAAGGFGNAVDGLGDNQAKAEKAARAHREELEKLDTWFASKGVLTATGYSNALADIIAKLNLAATDGTPTLQAALRVLAPEFDRVAAAAKASGQDVSIVNGIYRDFLELAGSDDIAASMAAWETANVGTTASLEGIIDALPRVSVAAEGTALSATIMTDAFHEFGLKTPQELQKAADAARFAYQQIVATVGKNAPAAIEAHKKMVDAINAQTGRIPSYWQTTIFPRVKDVVDHIQTALTGSFSQMLLGAKSFKDGFIDVWKSIKAGVLQILAQIADAFINSFLKGILGYLTGQKGAFSQAFSGLFGGAGKGILGGLLGGGGSAAGGVAVGGSTGGLLGAGGASTTGGLLGAGTTGGSAAAGGGAAAGGTGGTAAGGGLAAGLAGGAAAAGGGVLLGLLGKQIFGGAGWKAGGFGAASGAATGAMIGSVVPVLGTAIGALVGGLAGLFSGWLGKTQAMKVNDARDQVFVQMGESMGGFKGGAGKGSTYEAVAAELAKLSVASGGGANGGTLFRDLVKSGNFKDFEAAVKRVQAALESTEYATVKVREATEQLTAERDKLTASGESEDAVLRQQAASYSTLFQSIQATGATAPASLEPILAKLVEMGLLVDATGQKVTDLSKTFPAVGEEAAKQGTAIEVAMARSQAAINGINTDDPQAAVAAVRSALEALGTETAPAASAALQQAIDALNTNNPQAALVALQSALDGLNAQQATQAIAQLGPAIDGQTKHWETFTDEAGQVWTVVGGVVGKIKGDLNEMAAQSEFAFTRLGDVAADQADRARAALASIGRGIPPISIRYRYQQDGPGLPDRADRGFSTGGLVTRYLATGGVVKTVGALAASALLATAPLYAAHGTFVPKGPDTVPIMGQPGEFMQRVSAVQRHGVPAMEAINEGHATVLLGAGSLLPPTLTLPTQAAARAVAAVAEREAGESTRTPAPSTTPGAQAMTTGGPVGRVSVFVAPTPLRLQAGGSVHLTPAHHAVAGPVSHAAYYHQGGAVTGDVSYRTIGGHAVYRMIGGSVFQSLAGDVSTSYRSHGGPISDAASSPHYLALGGPVSHVTTYGDSAAAHHVGAVSYTAHTSSTGGDAYRAFGGPIYRMTGGPIVTVGGHDVRGGDVTSQSVYRTVGGSVIGPVSSTAYTSAAYHALGGHLSVDAGGPIAGTLQAGSITVPPIQTTLEVDTEPARRAVASLQDVQPIAVETRADLSGAFHTLAALQQVPDVRVGVAVDPVMALGQLASLDQARTVTVAVTASGVPEVQGELETLPDQHPVPVPVTAVGLGAVLGGIATIPRTIDVAVNYRTGAPPPPPEPPREPGIPSPVPYPDRTFPSPTPYPDPRLPLPTPLPYPGPVIGSSGGGSMRTPGAGGISTRTGSGGGFTMPHHMAGGVFATPHVAMIAEGGRPEIIGDEAFMVRALARALAHVSGQATGQPGFFQSLSRLPPPPVVQMPSLAPESILSPARAGDGRSSHTTTSRGVGDGSSGGVTFTGDLHIAVPPGTANPQTFGAQVADAFFGRLKRGGEHLDLMRHFVQKVRT